MALSKEIVWRGRTFSSRRDLAAHLAEVTGHSATACYAALEKKFDWDADKVIAHYRDRDTRNPPVFQHDGQHFSSQMALARHLAVLTGRSEVTCQKHLSRNGNDAAVVIDYFRNVDDLDQYGVLARALRVALREQGWTNLDDLTVLSSKNDPFRYDHDGGHAIARWFADVMNRLAPDGAVHLRGLHYRIVVSADVVKPDGTVYANNDADWTWLMEDASAAARWLDYVPFERIVDERNDPPVLPEEEDEEGASFDLYRGASVDLPGLDEAMPEVLCEIAVRQPYRIVLWGEKSSLGAVLSPIRERVNGELLLPTGESTVTMVYNVARRCVEDGRPAVIVYFGDFDPAGHQMAISIARKLQALKLLCFPDLDVRVLPAALTFKQVDRLNLPSTPLKDTERRADRWRERWGREQTEIDALAALDPEELRRIAEAAIAPFWDPTLPARVQRVREESNRIAAARLAATPGYADARAAVGEALAALETAADDLSAAQETALEVISDIEMPEIEPPEPKLTGEPPEPLFTTDDDYAPATLRLKAHRALEGGEDC